MKSFYFACRSKNRELISKIADFLIKNNYTVSFKWWPFFDLLLPYNKNRDKCKTVSRKISAAILKTDVFILISDEGGTDMFIELGIAIANKIKNNYPKIYIVGKYNKRSLMHFHPEIIQVNTLKEVFRKECPELKFSFLK